MKQISEAKPRRGMMPSDMPADLQAEAKEVHDEIRTWFQENSGSTFRDLPDEYREKMKSIRQKYEEETGNQWPRPHGRRGGRRGGGRNDTSTDY